MDNMDWGEPSSPWVVVESEGVEDDDQLKDWIERFLIGLPVMSNALTCGSRSANSPSSGPRRAIREFFHPHDSHQHSAASRRQMGTPQKSTNRHPRSATGVERDPG